MRNPINPQLHGALDHGFPVVNLLAPGLVGLPGRTRTVFAMFGIAQGGLNALTDQPLAMRQVIPFATHDSIERNSLPVFVGLPLLSGILHERRSLGYRLGAGAAVATVYSLTDWRAKNRAGTR